MKPIKEAVIKDFSDAVRLDNFRLDSNGALIKREGYSLAQYLDGKVRGALNDYETSYIVTGYNFYKYADGSITYIGNLSNASFDDDDETVYMFIYARAVYIMGGGVLYKYHTDEGTFEQLTGYCPLVIKNSDCLCTEYEVYEAVNIAGCGVRAHYNFNSSNKKYYLWGYAASVKAIFINGIQRANSYYSVTINGNESYITLSTSQFTGATDLVIEYELDPTRYPGVRDKLFKRTRAAVYEKDGEVRLLIYGGELGDKVYVSDFSRFDPIECVTESYTATKEDGTTFKTIYEVLPIHIKNRHDYFIETGYSAVGYNGDSVRAIERLTDHYMIFTRCATYHVEYVKGLITENGFETTGIKACLITDEYGIGEASGTAVYEDELYFYNENGLCKYSYNSLTYDFIATHIDIAEYAAPDRHLGDKVKLFLYRRYDELWCCYDGYVSVYSLKHKLWYRFSGITADIMFCHDSHAALTSGDRLYIFDEDSYTDGGTGFEAVFESKNYDLGNKFAKKTLFGFGVCTDRAIGGSLDCTLTSDKGISLTLTFTPDAASTVSPAVMRTHTRLSDVSFVKCVLISPAGRAPSNVREIMFRYREIGGGQ